jgi:myo-inositol-1-phosphate synthase
MAKKEIRVAIVGIGNCASSFVQGYFYYNQHKAETSHPGVMNWDLGGYTPCDIVPVAAFDVDERKIGKDITEAIFLGPNCAYRYDCEIKPLGVPVMMGPVLDGVASHMGEHFHPSDAKPVDVGQVLKDKKVDVVLSFLPTGSDKANSYYADQAINVAKAGWVSGMPSPVANDPVFVKAAEKNKVPIVGDDIKSQLGGTITHRALIDLMNSRGITITRTYQMNYAGNTDFKNMMEGAEQRIKKKLASKDRGIGAFVKKETSISSAGGVINNMGDRKTTIFHFEGYNYGRAPLTVKTILEVEDSPNFAGCIADAVRYCKIALDRGVGGVLESASAFLMKSPPKQINDEQAVEMLKEFVEGKRER